MARILKLQRLALATPNPVGLGNSLSSSMSMCCNGGD
jgi:hypothetical protein